MKSLVTLSLIILFTSLSYNHCASNNDNQPQSWLPSLIKPVFGLAVATQLFIYKICHDEYVNVSKDIDKRTKNYHQMRLAQTPFMGQFEGNSEPIRAIDQHDINQAIQEKKRNKNRGQYREEEIKEKSETEKQIRMKIALANHMQTLLTKELESEQKLYGDFFTHYITTTYHENDPTQLLANQNQQTLFFAEQASQTSVMTAVLERDFNKYKEEKIKNSRPLGEETKTALTSYYQGNLFLVTSILTALTGFALNRHFSPSTPPTIT